MKCGRILAIWLLLGACFSESNSGSDVDTATDSASGSETHTTGTTGPASSDGGGATGSGGGGTSADTVTTSGQTSDGSFTGTGATDSWTDGPYYGPCSDLGGCGPIIEECIHHYYGDICAAPCVTAADCPPPPLGQEVSCRDIDYTLPGEECVLVCTGTMDESTCEAPTHCVTVDDYIKICVYPE
jgi:hypothetical protein